MSKQYSTDENLSARQRLWAISPQQPAFDLQEWVLQLARVGAGSRVLEVGCGNGGYLRLVDAVGIDVSLGMLRSARQRALGPVVCANAEDLPFGDRSFDVVLVPHMLYHVQDRTRAIGELRRVLKPGGLCIAVTNSDTNQPELVRLVEDAVGRGWRWLRRSTAGFSLENGGTQLHREFDRVERVDCPVRTVSIRDAGALADYLLSLETEYETELPPWIAWADLVEACRQRVATQIRAEGTFPVTLHVGAFVCD